MSRSQSDDVFSLRTETVTVCENLIRINAIFCTDEPIQ